MRGRERVERVGLSVLFVNHDSWRLLAGALKSLLAHPPTDRTWEVIVVDDASRGGERVDVARVRDLVAEMDGCFLVRNEVAGYAAGMNMARQAARGRLLLVCHPDVRFQPGCVDRLTAHYDAHPGLGAVVPEIYADTGLECRLPAGELPTLSGHLRTTLATLAPSFAQLGSQSRTTRRLQAWGSASAVEVDAVTDACFLVARKLTERTGLFDEGFPLHYESADFSHRLHRAGRTIVQVPGARIVHLVGGSCSTDPERAAEMRARSRRYYYRKWYGQGGRWLHDLCLRLLVSRWGRARVRNRRPPLARPALLERGRPVVHLPSTSAAFLVEVGFDPWFHQVAGVFGRGSRWAPGETLLRRLSGPVWFRVVDLAGGAPRELGVWVYEPEAEQMFAEPYELEQGG